MVETKKKLPSELTKTQRIPDLVLAQKRLFLPGNRDAKAKRLISEYKRISIVLTLVRKYNPVNPLIFLLIKKKLAGLVQEEFELYKSLPELVLKEKRKSSTEIIASSLQQELTHASKGVSNRLNDLIKRKMLERQYIREVYTFRLPPIKVPAKTKKFKSVFTSAEMKKKFS